MGTKRAAGAIGLFFVSMWCGAIFSLISKEGTISWLLFVAFVSQAIALSLMAWLLWDREGKPRDAGDNEEK